MNSSSGFANTTPTSTRICSTAPMSTPCRRMAQQKRASGDPYFSHPLEVAAILTDLKLDDATIVAAVLHDTIEDTEHDARGDRPAVRAADRQARRRPDQDREARSRLQAGAAGREFSQTAAGRRGGRAGAAGQARRPAAQYADAAFRADGEARPHRAGNAGYLRAARRAHGHAEACARSWRGWRSAICRPRPIRPSRRACTSCAPRTAATSSASRRS